MLLGVLVIAFPVSVFSELWSHELKQVQGFEDLRGDGDDGNEEAAEARPMKPVDDDSPIVNEETALRQTQRLTESYEYHRDSVVMDKEDMKELVECVYNLKENQRRLYSILRKYRLHEEDHRGF